MSSFEDVTLLSHSLCTSPSTIDTWRLTRSSQQGSVQLVQQLSSPRQDDDTGNGRVIISDPPFTWPPNNKRHVDTIKVLLRVPPD